MRGANECSRLMLRKGHAKTVHDSRNPADRPWAVEPVSKKSEGALPGRHECSMRRSLPLFLLFAVAAPACGNGAEPRVGGTGGASISVGPGGGPMIGGIVPDGGTDFSTPKTCEEAASA